MQGRLYACDTTWINGEWIVQKIAYSFLSDLKYKNVHVYIYTYICKHFPIILDRYMARTYDVCFVKGHTPFETWNSKGGNSNEIKKEWRGGEGGGKM